MDDLVEKLERNWEERRMYEPDYRLFAEAAAEIRRLREQVAQERAGHMTAIDVARYRVSKWIAESHGGSYLIPGYLRGELDDSKAIMDALTAIERQQDNEPA